MRNKLIYTVLLIFFLVDTSFGQGFVFRVLASKGANMVKKGIDGNTVPLRTGAILMSGDELIATDGAYIGLMHKTGKTIEVRNSGVTKITDLESMLASTKNDVANKYAKFVMNKINNEDGTGNYRQNMKATGAVSRAVDGPIKVMLPSSVDVLNPEATIRWSETSEVENPTYQVVIKNIFDEEIFSSETKETSLTVNLDGEKLSKERLVILNVKVKDNGQLVSSDHGIKRMSSDDASSISANLASLKAQVPSDDDSPLNKIIYASFYEKNNLILDAITQYERAIELSPDVEGFKTLYDNFLIDNNLKNDK